MAGAIGTGLGGALVIGAETVYAATSVTLSRTVEVRSAKIDERVHTVQGWGLASGRSVELGSRRNTEWKDAGGDIETEFLNTGMALLLATALGSAATLAAITTGNTAFAATFAYGVPDNQNFFAAQALVPDTSGTLHPYTYHGGKITKAEWSVDRTNLLMCTYTTDFQHIETATVAVTPTQSTSNTAFDGVDLSSGSFKVGALGSEAAVDGVRKFTVSLEREMDTERIYVGDTATGKHEPLTKNWTKITCSMEVDLTSTNKSVLWDIYDSQTPVSVIADFVGAVIGTSGHNNEVKFSLPNCYLDTNGTPQLDGPDIVRATLNFTALIDTANDAPLSVYLVTSDTGW